MRFQEAVTDVDSTLGCIQIQMRRILADQSNVVHETVLSNFLLKNNRRRRRKSTVKILHVEFPYKEPGEGRDEELAASSIQQTLLKCNLMPQRRKRGETDSGCLRETPPTLIKVDGL